MRSRILKALTIVSLYGLLFFSLFYKLDIQPVETWDEATNIEVATNLAETNEFSAYEKNFFEKPPLWYFLTSLIFDVLGVSAFNARLLSVFSAIIIFSALIYILRREFSFLASLLGALAFIATPIFFISYPGGIFSTHTFRSADLDALFIMFIFLSFFSIYLSTKIPNLFFSGLFMTLAVATKGPLALIAIPLTIIFLKNFPQKIFLYLLSIFLLFLVTLIPWYSFMFLNYGITFFNSHFLYHIIERSVNPIEGHSAPFYFHIKNIIDPIIFPNGFIVLCSSLKVLTSKIQYSLFYSAFFVISLILTISIIETKITWYILPALPFGIILMIALIFRTDDWFVRAALFINAFSIFLYPFNLMYRFVFFIAYLILWIRSPKSSLIIMILVSLLISLVNITRIEPPNIVEILERFEATEINMENKDITLAEKYYLEEYNIPMCLKCEQPPIFISKNMISEREILLKNGKYYVYENN